MMQEIRDLEKTIKNNTKRLAVRVKNGPMMAGISRGPSKKRKKYGE
jgi:hypothetical protein